MLEEFLHKLAYNEFLEPAVVEFLEHYAFVKKDFADSQVVKGAMYKLKSKKERDAISSLVQNLVESIPNVEGSVEVCISTEIDA